MSKTNYNIIYDIEKITEHEAAEMAFFMKNIKGFNVYFANLPGNFKFSALVFGNNRMIHNANMYQLHYTESRKSALYRKYMQQLTNSLFTVDELSQPLSSYDEYTRKDNFLRNYYGSLQPYVSAFAIIHNEDEEKAYEEGIKDKYLSRVSFGYYDSPDFPEHLKDLQNQLEKAKADTLGNYDYWYKAFYHEFFNYECMIGGRYSEAIAAAAGSTQLNDTQKRAAKAAKADFYSYCIKHDLY